MNDEFKIHNVIDHKIEEDIDGFYGPTIIARFPVCPLPVQEFVKAQEAELVRNLCDALATEILAQTEPERAFTSCFLGDPYLSEHDPEYPDFSIDLELNFTAPEEDEDFAELEDWVHHPNIQTAITKATNQAIRKLFADHNQSLPELVVEIDGCGGG